MVELDAISASPSAVSPSWEHDPVATPDGVLVLAAQHGVAEDNVSVVEYGGVAIGELADSPVIKGPPGDTGTDGALYGYWLNENIPPGPQTVEITGDGPAKRALCITVTANGKPEIEDTAWILGDLTATPEVDLVTAVATAAFGLLLTNEGNAANVAPGAGMTQLHEADLGMIANWIRATANPPAGTPSLAWQLAAPTAGSAALAVAIKDPGRNPIQMIV